MTKTLGGGMWLILIRMSLTIVVGRLLVSALVGTYANLTQTLLGIIN